jgi:electron transfer flavoprotein alpha subunit
VSEPSRSPLRIAALVKQIPAFETMELSAEGRLQRDGLVLEMSAYDRRAVAQGVALARQSGGSCTVVTLGPPSAEDVLRESIAFGADHGVLVSDPVFAGSDSLVTARALAAAIERLGPFDLVLVGRNSVDAETGQVGPQVAQLLDLPFAAGVRQLEVEPDGTSVRVGCELDDEWVELTVNLPAVLSAAERLIDPVKIKDRAEWAAVDASRIERLDAATLGPGPWGQAGSPTWVGEVRVEQDHRRRRVLDGPLADQVAVVVDALAAAGLLAPGPDDQPGRPAGSPIAVPGGPGEPVATGPVVGVLVEPGRQRVVRELLGAAAELAAELGGRVVAIGPWLLAPEPVSADVTGVLATWGADALVVVEPAGSRRATAQLVEEDIARAVSGWIRQVEPVIVLGPSTAWGREVSSRVAAELGLGLTGDAIELELDPDDRPERRLVAWKPAFGGAMVAAVRSTSVSQMVTVRAGVLAPPEPRAVGRPIDRVDPVRPAVLTVTPRGRVQVRARRRDDDLEVLASARRVVAVGRGVDPTEYPELDGLLHALGAELAATRKVTDAGWLPHSRQVGITGLSLAPDLAMVVGASGRFNHMVGFRRAGLIVAINPDPAAPVFDFADYGIVGDWHEVVPELERRLRERPDPS